MACHIVYCGILLFLVVYKHELSHLFLFLALTRHPLHPCSDLSLCNEACVFLYCLFSLCPVFAGDVGKIVLF